MGYTATQFTVGLILAPMEAMNCNLNKITNDHFKFSIKHFKTPRVSRVLTPVRHFALNLQEVVYSKRMSTALRVDL